MTKDKKSNGAEIVPDPTTNKGGGPAAAAGQMLTTLESLEMPEDLTDRQKEVLKLRLRGLSQTAIAKVLGISQPVVNRHFKAIRKKMERDGKSINQDVVVGESLALFTEVEQRAWELYYTAKQKEKLNDANKALQLVLSAREKGLTLLMDLGLVKRAAVEHEHKVVSPLVKQWQDNVAQKKLVVTQVIATQLEELAEPVPPALEEDIEDAIIIEEDTDDDVSARRTEPAEEPGDAPD